MSLTSVERRSTYGTHAQPYLGSRPGFNVLVHALVEAGKRAVSVEFFGAMWIDRTPELDGGWVRDPGNGYVGRHQRRSLNMSPLASRPNWQVVLTFWNGRLRWYRSGLLPSWLNTMDADDFARFGGRDIDPTVPLERAGLTLEERVAHCLHRPTIPKEALTHG